ncbi:MAG TPA: TRAP transporter large permease [Syntrophorhabdaceae bacterium]|nr:TRAP transporter large permease [Syntrophorhabdaceae bacterium]
MSDVALGVYGIIVLLALFLTGMEMAVAMGIVGLAGYAIVISPSAATTMLANDFFDQLQSYSLTVVPLFVLMGQLAFNAGIARRLYDSAHKFLGHIPAGLALATVVGATIFKAICGSIVATSATFASVAVPEMDRFGYAKKLSTGIVATVGTLGVLIPPSVTLIILGIITQQSIGRLFLAGIVPGLMLAVSFIGVILGWGQLNPAIGPASEKYSWKERVSTLPAVLWPVVIFLVVIGGLMYGFFTPTEAGSVGTFAVLLLCVLKRDINYQGIRKSLQEALRTSCMVLLLVAASAVLGHFITVTDIPNNVAKWVSALPLNRHVIMSIIFLIYLFGGSVIDDLAFMILATPIFFPAIIQLGYDPIWACIMVSMTVCVGSVIPPVAMPVFIVKNITKVPMGVIYSGVYPFLIGLFICIILMFMFPSLITYLPTVLMK